ncbi:MAG: methyltransferase domain-containing protein [Chloroflexi bacterium]|nr:methyltransferase domain-containing protein [Chloroflexota bacterium]
MTNRYDSTRQAWENIWDNASVEQELQTEHYARAQETIRQYTAYLSKDKLILEAGSGLSAALITLKEQGYRVTGLDYAENALHISQHYDPSLVLAVGDVHTLPYAENTFGGYLSFGVLEHFEAGMAKPLAEAFRVLDHGGILVLTIPYPNVVNRYVAWNRRRQGVSVLNDDDFFESTYTREKLEANVKGAGFEVLEAIPTSHSYTLWGLGGAFRAPGYYQTSALAESLGKVLKAVLPWAFNFTTLIIAKKP